MAQAVVQTEVELEQMMEVEAAVETQAHYRRRVAAVALAPSHSQKLPPPLLPPLPLRQKNGARFEKMVVGIRLHQTITSTWTV